MRSDGRGDDCASDLSFDLLLADDLPADAANGLRAHLATCARCAARFADVKAGFDAPLAPFAVADVAVARDAPLPFATVPRRRRRVMPGLMAVGACAAAIVLYLVVRPGGEPGGTRVKGGVSFTLFIKHGAHIRPAGLEENVSPGDQLQLTYTAQEPGYLAMVSLDGAGIASVYFPDGQADAWPAAPGAKVSLPRSTVLDDVLGQEVVLVVYCPRSFAVEPVRLALLNAAATFPPHPGCIVERFVLDKRGAN